MLWLKIRILRKKGFRTKILCMNMINCCSFIVNLHVFFPKVKWFYSSLACDPSNLFFSLWLAFFRFIGWTFNESSLYVPKVRWWIPAEFSHKKEQNVKICNCTIISFVYKILKKGQKTTTNNWRYLKLWISIWFSSTFEIWHPDIQEKSAMKTF